MTLTATVPENANNTTVLRPRWPLVALLLVGMAEIGLMTWLGQIPDLVAATPVFVGLWLSLAALNGVAIWIVCQRHVPLKAGLVMVFAVGTLLRIVLLPAWPHSSDDMFRYIWDGRVQAAGINPYLYPPAAPELAYLRDETIWPGINRKPSPTIYPPAAQLLFAGVYRLVPDSVIGTKAVFSVIDIAAGAALAYVLFLTGRTPLLSVVYLWHPLPAFEFAHAGHLDTLLILTVLLALIARVKEKPAWVGGLIAFAALIKFFPALLLGAWWRFREWRLPLAFLAVVAVLYLSHVQAGSAVLGFLPSYFGEEEYVSGGRYFFYPLIGWVVPPAGWSVLVLAVLGGVSLWFLRHPVERFSVAWATRGLIIATVAMLLVTPSFPWYYAWLLPLMAFRPSVALLWLPATVVFAYAWWWWPPMSAVPGPGIWIFIPPLLLLGWQAFRTRTT